MVRGEPAHIEYLDSWGCSTSVIPGLSKREAIGSVENKAANTSEPVRLFKESDRQHHGSTASIVSGMDLTL
jgi:hypothetical protein